MSIRWTWKHVVLLAVLLGTVGYVAVLLHGYFLLISLAQPGLPRYALAMWPASMLLVFSTIAVTVKRR